MVIGYAATATLGGNGGNVIVGNSAHTTGQEATAIGDTATAVTGSIALGALATTTSSGQFVVGGNGYAIQNAYIGNGVTNAAPSAVNIQGTGSSTAGTAGANVTLLGGTGASGGSAGGVLTVEGGLAAGVNQLGGNLVLAGGRGTGAANGGDILLQVSGNNGGSGAANDALTTVASINGGTGATLFKNFANSNTAFRVQNAAGTQTVLNVDTTGTGNFSINGQSTLTTSFSVGTQNNLTVSHTTSGTADGSGLVVNRTSTSSSNSNTGITVNESDTSWGQGINIASTHQGIGVSTAGGSGASLGANYNSIGVLVSSAGDSSFVGIQNGSGSSVQTLLRYSNTDADTISLVRGRGTAGSQVMPSSGDMLGGITFNSQTSTGSDWGNANTTAGAAIRSYLTAAPSLNTVSADLRFYTTNNGSTPTQVAKLSSNGAAQFQNSADSTMAFQIQSAAAADTLFTASTSTNKLVVGNSTGTDTATTLLQLDSATADPTSNLVNGSMYYNSSTNKFRCYQNAAWQDCIGTNQSNTFQLNGNSFAQTASLGTNDNFDLNLRTSGAARLTVNSGTNANAPGGVGIGTAAGNASTYTMLQVQGSNNSTATSQYLGYFSARDTATSEGGAGINNFALSVESQKTGTADRVTAANGSINGGIYNNLYIQGGTTPLAIGYQSNITPTGGTITTAVNYYAAGLNGAVSASGTITNRRGLWVGDAGYSLGGTQYGIYLENMTSGATDYSIYTQAGTARFGDTVQVQGINVSGSGNAAANTALTVQGGTGQTSTSNTGSGGGAGGAISLATGAGGATATAQLNAVLVGGAGGAYTLTTGTGGQANQGALGGNVTGGAGGDITIASGNGGTATGSAGNSRSGGRGGDIALQGGSGGTGSSANGRNGYVTLQANGGNVGIGTSTPANLLSIGALTTAANTYQVAVTTGGTTSSGIVVQTVAGQSSGNILQAQDSTGAALATIDYQGNLTVKSATIAGSTTTFATLTLSEAHFKVTQTNKPTIGTPTTCGTSPTATVANNSTDNAGSFTITSGSGTQTSTCQAVITFNKAFGAAPKSVILTGASTNASKENPAITATSSTTFTVVLPVTTVASTAYTFYYWVVE